MAVKTSYTLSVLLIKTYVAPSKIHGNGLFAAQDVPEGTLVWQYSPQVDGHGSFAPKTHKAWLEPTGWYWCGDDAKFINHSTTPNLISSNGKTYAKRKINIGDELTEDYSKYDLNWTQYSSSMK